MDYFIGDLHFGDRSILRFERPEFESVEFMHTFMIAGWKERVTQEDRVFVLGDLGTPTFLLDHGTFLRDLPGEKHLVRGNHDSLRRQDYQKMGFSMVYDFPILYHNFYLLSHEPLFVQMSSPYANLFAHVHNNPTYRTVSPRSFCVSAERMDYRPISFLDVVERMERVAEEWDSTDSPDGLL